MRIKHVVRPQGAVFNQAPSPAVPEGKRPSVSTLVQLVNNHLQKFASPISVEVRESVTELGYPAGMGAKGMTVNGTVYLFRDRLTSLADARDTLFHEISHLGSRRFLTRSQYLTTMLNIHPNDPRIRMMADAWKETEEGKELAADAANGVEYVTARATDEALAHMADRVANSEAGFVDNTLSAKALRTYRRVLARIAEWCGDKRKAEGYRGVTNGARALIRDVFQRLSNGDATAP